MKWMMIMAICLGMFLVAGPTHAGLVNQWDSFEDAKLSIDGLADQLNPRQGVAWYFEFDGHNLQNLTTVSLYDFKLEDTRYLSLDIGYTPQEVLHSGVSANLEPWIEYIPHVGPGLLRTLDLLPGDLIALEAGGGYGHSFQLQKGSPSIYAPVIKYSF